MTTKTERHEEINPKWLKQSMTLLQAANQAKLRGMYLKVSWSDNLGCRIVAVPR